MSKSCICWLKTEYWTRGIQKWLFSSQIYTSWYCDFCHYVQQRIFNMSEHIDVNYVKMNGEWDLAAYRTVPSVVWYNSSQVAGTPYYELFFYITLKRRSGYFLLNIGMYVVFLLCLIDLLVFFYKERFISTGKQGIAPDYSLLLIRGDLLSMDDPCHVIVTWLIDLSLW